MERIPTLGPRGEGWVVLQVLLLGVIGIGGVVSSTAFPDPWSVGAIIAGAGFAACGATLGVAGVVALRSGDALTAVPRPRDAGRLVESGAYGLVRHPIYGALVLGAVGWALWRGSPVAAVGTAALFVVLDLKRRVEEVWLLERYPGYAAYRLRTRRFVPWVW